jgi:predicted dehydrogenase
MNPSSAAPLVTGELRLGLIGLDTSHVEAFTRLLNDPEAEGHIAGARVFAAYKTFSPDMTLSASRVEGYTRLITKNYGVRLAASIAELCAEVDAVLITSLDGRTHLPHARAVLEATGGQKPLFIDKPLAASLADAREIYRLARAAGTPVFTASAYRFYPSLLALKAAQIGELRAAISYGPAHFGEHHPDLFFYGIHPAEALFAVMGRGCESVTRTFSDDTDVTVGRWPGGRLGVLHALRTGAMGTLPHQVTLFGTAGTAIQQPDDGGIQYAPLLREILRFFQTRVAPVDPDETLEVFAFLEAARLSRERGGVPVGLAEVE